MDNSSPSNWIRPGTWIGQYEVVSRPMMGGMGVVYFALDHDNNNRPFAIKTFRPEILPDRAARDRFLRESSIWVELGNHPHIVRCHKVQNIYPQVFLVLDLIAKEQNMADASLRSWFIPGRSLPLEQALLFALQIARGMLYATEKISGFVHRDIKPENILVSAEKLPNTKINHLRITDFGLVKALGDSDASLVTNSHQKWQPKKFQFTRGVGTPLYMAPEQWKGETVGVFTDVYAFGCLLYEMVSGQYVVEGTTLSQLRELHCEGKLRSIPEGLPKEVFALIKDCLNLSPSQRYSSWGEIIVSLENAYRSNYREIPLPPSLTTEIDRDQERQTLWSFITLGYSHEDISQTEIAANYFNRALSIARKIDDKEGESAALNGLGGTYLSFRDDERAISLYEQSRKISQLIGYRRGEGYALGNLGLVYFERGEYSHSIKLYEQALKIARETDNIEGEWRLLANLGQIYLNMNITDEARKHYEQVIAICQEISDLKGLLGGVISLGECFRRAGNLQKAIEYFTEALTMSRELGDKFEEEIVLGNLGSAYRDLGEYEKAIQFHQQALLIDQEIGDRKGEGADLGNIGLAYAQLGDQQQALDYYERAISVRRDIGDKLGLAITLYNTAALYVQYGDALKALPLAQEADDIYVDVGNKSYAEDSKKLIETINIRVAFDAFKKADAPKDMLTVVGAYPFTINKEFIEGIELLLNELVESEYKIAVLERLTWLKEIAQSRRGSTLKRLFGKRK